MRHFASLGLWPFPDAIFYLFVGELLENHWGKLVGFSSVKDVDLIQFNLKSVSIFSYYWFRFWVKTYRVFHALLSRHTCEILQARNCDLFPTIYLISLSENYSKTIEWKLARFLSVKDVDLIQSNLESVSILVIIIDYVLGTKHIESTMFCYTLVKHARFWEPGIVTFSPRYI